MNEEAIILPPFLVKILHSDQIQSKEIKRRVGKALHNIVHAHPEQKQYKREAKILRLLEVLRMYSDFLKDMKASGQIFKECGAVCVPIIACTPCGRHVGIGLIKVVAGVAVC